ncbi:hypothetical protein CR513_07480, partial [Mucuna pruriens]
MYATSLLSRLMQRPGQIYYRETKIILRYLQGMKEFGISYKTMTNSRRHEEYYTKIVQSITEAEYVTVVESTCQAIQRILEKMREQQKRRIMIYY